MGIIPTEYILILVIHLDTLENDYSVGLWTQMAHFGLNFMQDPIYYLAPVCHHFNKGAVIILWVSGHQC